MAESTDRAAFVRGEMRKSWGERTAVYAQSTAAGTAPFAAALVELAALRPGERVLDLATGPGPVALAAARAVGPSGSVLATDLVPEWAEIVARNAAAAGLANVEFRTMPAEALDLPSGSFDAVLCQFGLMFVGEPVRALAEMRRVLRPDGRAAFAVWSTVDRVPLFSVVEDALEPYRIDRPSDGLPGPLALGAGGLIESLAAEAGFSDIRAERRTYDWPMPEPDAIWRSRVVEGPPDVQAIYQRLDEPSRRRLRDDLIAAFERYRQPEGIRLPCEAIFVVARD